MSLFDQYAPSAKVVDGMLILSLLDAIQPVVWQMELGQSKSSALEVRPKDDGTFGLYLKTPRADVQEIAPYATKEKAIRALSAVTRAMERAQGHIRAISDHAPCLDKAYSDKQLPVVMPRAQSTPVSMANFAKIAAAITVVIVLVALVTFSSPKKPLQSFNTEATTAVEAAPVEIENGEAVSADDFLNQAE